MSDLINKKMLKPQDYEMIGDKVFFIIPRGNYDEHRLVMTRDLFIACYEHWIQKAEDNTESPIDRKTGKWLDMGKFIDIDGDYHEAWKCDCCGYVSYDDSNFCPNCGARMED